ncbi:unnamed protein product [Orchesella dallaii]|uniref:MYND-type domain-containing protein n=1 Tax=Orchesella dallaii TaxID=48710 RepID=A0ABP1S1E2_9HEXA
MDNRMQTGVDMNNPELLPKTLAEILTKTPEQFAKWKENEHILDPVFRVMFDKMMEETHKDKFPGETIMLRGLQYQSEPEKAKAMFHAARYLKHLTIKERKERIDCVLGMPFEAGSGSAPIDSILAFHKKLAMEKFAVLKTTVSNVIGSEAKKKREGDDVIDVKLIGTKAKDGSELAIRIRETRQIGQNLIQFVEKKNTFSEEKKRKVLSMLYEMAIRDFEVISFGKETETKLKQLIDELLKSKSGSISKNEEEMKIRLVYVRLNYMAGTSGGTSAAALLKQGIKMYPDNVHYYRLLCVHETDPQFGLSIAEKGLQTFGDDVELLYFKAVFFRSIHLKLHSEHPLHVNVSETEAPRKRKIVIDAYENFLSKAPPGHPNVPNAYFGIAMVHLLILTTTDKVEHFLQQGKEAEGKVLSNASRDTRNADDKLIVETFLSLLSGGMDKDDAGTDILVGKMYLNSPVRRWLITQHRKNIDDIYIKKIECKTCSPDPIRSMKVPRDNPFPERMGKVTPITLKEMNPTKAQVYHERMIELVIIDVANTSCRCPMIHFIVEDEDGDVTRLNLIGYGTWLEEGGDLAKYGLEIGAKIGLVNPCMLPLKRGQQMLFGIFVEDPDRLISLGRVENMCRFCGDEGAVSNPLKCARCQNAVYCSKECQENDWKFMKHKLVCIPPRIVYDIHIV